MWRCVQVVGLGLDEALEHGRWTDCFSCPYLFMVLQVVGSGLDEALERAWTEAADKAGGGFRCVR